MPPQQYRMMQDFALAVGAGSCDAARDRESRKAGREKPPIPTVVASILRRDGSNAGLSMVIGTSAAIEAQAPQEGTCILLDPSTTPKAEGDRSLESEYGAGDSRQQAGGAEEEKRGLGK